MCLFGQSKDENVKGQTVITLKEALKLPKDAIKEIRDDLKQKIEASRSLGAYVEQFTCKPISE